jgi:hypothetical protein
MHMQVTQMKAATATTPKAINADFSVSFIVLDLGVSV